MAVSAGRAGPHREGGHSRKAHSASGHGGMKFGKGKSDRMESKSTKKLARKTKSIKGGRIPS